MLRSFKDEVIEYTHTEELHLDKEQTKELETKMFYIYNCICEIEDSFVEGHTVHNILKENGISSEDLHKYFLRLGLDVE